MVALMAIAAFAGLRRASTALIDYPTSQAGIAVSGTAEFSTVKINSNANTVNGIKFANGYTTEGVLNANVAELSVEGGFKTGDVVTIAGAFNYSDDTKTSKIDLFTVDGEGHITVLFTTNQFVNGRTQAADPAPETYTLLADADKLYLGRNGNTATFVTLLTVTRAAEDGAIATIAALTALEDKATFTYSGKATVVAMPKKQYVYVQDETGSTLIYDKDGSKTADLAVGKQIAAPWTGAVSIFNGLFELVPDAALAVTADEAVTPTIPEVTIADITEANVNKVVKLTNVTVIGVNGNDFVIKNGELSVAGYDQFGVKGADFANGMVCSEMIGAIGKFKDAIQFQPLSYTVGTAAPEAADVEISPEAGADISAALSAASVAPVKNITINLAAGNYTISKSIPAAANVIINGNGATIDASALSGAFILMSKTPAVEANVKGSYLIDIIVDNVTINGVKSRFFYDNKTKYVANNFTIKNSIIQLATTTAVDGAIDFNQGGAINFTIENSTVYQTGEANVNYFTKYNNSIVPDNAIDGYTECNFWTYKNNTFYKVAANQWHNGGRISQKASTMTIDVENNVWVDCCADILRRMFAQKTFSTFKEGSVLSGNLFNRENVVESQGNYGNGTDVNGVLTFVDATAGKFNGTCKLLTLDATAPEGKVGDPRWTITYTQANVTIWSSEEPAALSWSEANIAVAAEKFANAKVGDVMHVLLQDVPTEATNPWDAQVALRGQNWKDLEGSVHVAGTAGGTAAKTVADFILTGDILAIAKEQGVQFNGAGCKTAQITLEYADEVAGSDASIWFGSSTKNNVSININHFANSNLFNGIKVGDKIRVTVKKTDAEKDNWIGLNYTNASWAWSDFAEGSFAATTTETSDGAIVDFEVLTADVAAIMNNRDNVAVVVNNPNQTVTQVELIVAPVDITIAPTEGDIAAALKAETDKVVKVGNITINLTENGAYTVGATLVAPNSITINGNGAIIDASALEANLIEFAAKAAEDTEWTNANVSISGVTVKGLKKALFFSNSKYYYGDFSLINSVVEQAADATTFDYTKGSVAVNFTVTCSTIYAPTATTKSLYSSQGGQKATEYKDDATQSFAFLLNTMYNLAPGKNFFTHRQSNQKWLAYGVHSNIFVNCGKSGQVIKGMNGGQSGANPTWVISGNAFNFDGADTSAAEATGDDEEPVKESVAGIVTFTDAANGNFSGNVLLPAAATAPTGLGDPRWTITYTNAPEKLYVIGDMNNWDRTALTEMTFNAETKAFEFEFAPDKFTSFAFATKQMTADEATADPNWEDFNANYRYSIGEGDNVAELNKALALLKVNGTVQVKPVKEGTTYKISIAWDLSTVTIAGEAAPELEPVYVVAGSSTALFGTEWSGDAEANQMTLNTETGLYEKKYTNVALTAGNIEYKIVKNGSTWIPDGMGNNQIVEIPADGNYDVTFTFDPTTSAITGVATVATGINSIAADKMEDATIYTIGGQRVEKAQKGLYIINGKKVVVK